MSDKYLAIDYVSLEPETLDNLLGMFVLREGTDYGESEVPFSEKKAQLLESLKSGKAKIVYDEKLEECNIIPSE